MFALVRFTWYLGWLLFVLFGVSVCVFGLVLFNGLVWLVVGLILVFACCLGALWSVCLIDGVW